MDKRKKTYSLDDVRNLIKNNSCKLTGRATKTSHSLGFSRTEAKEVIYNLENKDFFKATTENKNHKVWQDVYKKQHKGKHLYIKFKITTIEDQTLLVLSFKKDTDYQA